MSYCVVVTAYASVDLVIAVAHTASGTEGAVVMVMMECIATMPIPIVCPAVMIVPPGWVITPIPRRIPCAPCGTPKPIVDHGTIDINRLDDIVGTIHIFVTYYLYRYIVGFIFLDVDGRYILVDILGQNSLKHDESFVAFTCFYDAKVIHLAISVEVEIAESAVRVVEHHLELLKVFSFCK